LAWLPTRELERQATSEIELCSSSGHRINASFHPQIAAARVMHA
jgi:hypothetical protein